MCSVITKKKMCVAMCHRTAWIVVSDSMNTCVALQVNPHDTVVGLYTLNAVDP